MSDVSPNAVIAANVRRIRRDRGWTQTELAERLTERDTKRWTVSMVSDAEGSGHGDVDSRGRNRQWTVNEVNVLARVFQVSAIALFVPTPDQHVRIGDAHYTRDDYVDLVLQFPPQAMSPGFVEDLHCQYVQRNHGTDRLLWVRPPGRPSQPGDVAHVTLGRFLRSQTSPSQREDTDGEH